MDFSKVKIETERLFLVPLSLKYAQDIFEEFTPEVTRYMFPKSPEKIQDTIDYINEWSVKMRNGEGWVGTVLKKDNLEFLGGIGLHNTQSRVFEFGIWIKKSAHGNKYGQEAVAGVKKWAEENLDFDYFIYPADINNISSRKIAEVLGGVSHRQYNKKTPSGKILNMIEYRIVKTSDV